MLSKRVSVAITALTAFLFASCRTVLPWSGERANEVNLSFVIENNLLFLNSVRINNQPARIFFASANLTTAVDPAFAQRMGARSYSLNLTDRDVLPLRPVVLGLAGIGDVLVGADAWDSHAVTIDYRTGLLTYQKDGIYPDYMTVFRFDAEPKIMIDVDGRQMPAVVDTALPDTLVLPRGATPAGRRGANISIAGTNFGTVDIGVGDVTAPRIGNRLLSKFLVSIDYGRRRVAVWRDPRIPM